jgi:hypothetical protein
MTLSTKASYKFTSHTYTHRNELQTVKFMTQAHTIDIHVKPARKIMKTLADMAPGTV